MEKILKLLSIVSIIVIICVDINLKSKLILIILLVSQYIMINIFIEPNKKLLFRTKKLTDKEQEMVNDAKEIIEKIDDSIVINKFTVYKTKFVTYGWFNYNKKTREPCIYIPFKYFLGFGKNICFMVVLHEILHSQNLKNNLHIFTNSFLEGINQLLTIWIIENYSDNYKVPINFKVYEQEVEQVRNILGDIDYKEVFLNYINLNPEYFKKIVPEEYFIR